MANFERERLLSNIVALAKEKNIKIGELEEKAGVSIGYFSRLNKAGINTTPSIEVLAKVSEALETTIDALVSIDYAILSPTEKYLIDFIDKMIRLTEANDLNWKAETKKAILSEADPYSEICNPLFGFVKTVEFDPVLCKNINTSKCMYRSLFRKGEFVEPTDPILHFHSEFSKATFWLSKVSIVKDDSTTKSEIEFYAQQDCEDSIRQIVHTDSNDNSPINQHLSCLYNTAIIACKKPIIDSEVEKMIDSFMVDLPF